jgi:outer membrane biogenesis lipoprotein LolB
LTRNENACDATKAKTIIIKEKEADVKYHRLSWKQMQRYETNIDLSCRLGSTMLNVSCFTTTTNSESIVQVRVGSS